MEGRLQGQRVEVRGHGEQEWGCMMRNPQKINKKSKKRKDVLLFSQALPLGFYTINHYTVTLVAPEPHSR